jgi:hypothetical protein
MPIVFVHTEVIPSTHGVEAIVLGILGALIVYGSVIAYFFFFHRKDDDSF